jgi:hypothetical protein
MSERAIGFVENWVSDNVGADGCQAEGDNSEALAAQCVKAANAEGISQAEIDAAFDDLTAFIAGEIKEANDRKLAGLAANDD